MPGKGSQLKGIPWQAVVCLADAEKMTQDEFENVADTFGEKFGVARRNVNSTERSSAVFRAANSRCRRC